MLSNTLSIIEAILHKQLNNDALVTEMLEFFGHFRKNQWLYPGVLKRKFSLELSDIYTVLIEMEQQGVLQQYYELFCSCCQKSMGTVELFNELPPTFECELCNTELPTLENSFMIFKVLRDD